MGLYMGDVILIADDDILIFQSADHLSSAIEFQSFDGDEEAVCEDGSEVLLSVAEGAWIKRPLIGKVQFVSDFKFVSTQIGRNKSEYFVDRISRILKSKGISIEPGANLRDLFEIVRRNFKYS